jgi:hypothetical protein
LLLITKHKGKGKSKAHPIKGHEGPEVEKKYSSTLSLTWALYGGGWLTSGTGRFTPGKDPVPTVWAPGPVWTGAVNRAIRIRSPDCLACSKSV